MNEEYVYVYKKDIEELREDYITVTEYYKGKCKEYDNLSQGIREYIELLRGLNNAPKAHTDVFVKEIEFSEAVARDLERILRGDR